MMLGKNARVIQLICPGCKKYILIVTEPDKKISHICPVCGTVIGKQ